MEVDDPQQGSGPLVGGTVAQAVERMEGRCAGEDEEEESQAAVPVSRASTGQPKGSFFSFSWGMGTTMGTAMGTAPLNPKPLLRSVCCNLL
jgi:hypothetical protein